MALNECDKNHILACASVSSVGGALPLRRSEGKRFDAAFCNCATHLDLSLDLSSLPFPSCRGTLSAIYDVSGRRHKSFATLLSGLGALIAGIDAG